MSWPRKKLRYYSLKRMTISEWIDDEKTVFDNSDIRLLHWVCRCKAATLKIATVTPEGSQWMTDMRAGAKEIKERTEGRVQIKYYGGGVMGNDQKVLSRIRIGSLQGGAFTPSALAVQYSDLNLYGLPMVFDSEEEAAFVRARMDAS